MLRRSKQEYSQKNWPSKIVTSISSTSQSNYGGQLNWHRRRHMYVICQIWATAPYMLRPLPLASSASQSKELCFHLPRFRTALLNIVSSFWTYSILTVVWFSGEYLIFWFVYKSILSHYVIVVLLGLTHLLQHGKLTCCLLNASVDLQSMLQTTFDFQFFGLKLGWMIQLKNSWTSEKLKVWLI